MITSGYTKTIMISCVSPSSVYLEETILTLKYAEKASNIQNQSKNLKTHLQNQILTESEKEFVTLIKKNKELEQENINLKKIIQKKTKNKENKPINKEFTKSIDSRDDLIEDYKSKIFSMKNKFNFEKKQYKDLNSKMKTVVKDNNFLVNRLENLEEIFVEVLNEKKFPFDQNLNDHFYNFPTVISN